MAQVQTYGKIEIQYDRLCPLERIVQSFNGNRSAMHPLINQVAHTFMDKILPVGHGFRIPERPVIGQMKRTGGRRQYVRQVHDLFYGIHGHMPFFLIRMTKVDIRGQMNIIGDIKCFCQIGQISDFPGCGQAFRHCTLEHEQLDFIQV